MGVSQLGQAEGGLTTEEVDTFTRAGGRAALISDAVLRTSTAGAAAAAVLSARTGRW